VARRAASQRRVCVAKIGAPHGVRGEVKLWPYTADPMTVADFGALESEDGKISFEIEALRPGKNFLVARFKGVSDRTAAGKLNNLELYVARENFPEPEPDEFYHADLIGLAVTDKSGAALGTIVAVHNFGAGDLIEVKPAHGPAFMLPFTAAAVPVIDIAGGRVVVEPPEGTFDTSR
jgi:16S rRNA processing protein RimM